ncbi:endoribonuclease L-PSP [Pilibacter termitis]|uniref:Endoribonuclease L-PSP n=1 Tax=Pilibacter termitis TaxID=263852 RepID=A0A1T4RB46_9ENTE|nr:Rid family detoxifying hydrolase [Pilibacter termitis]SKA13193.1 endoribonuclease L-PSP [Pilibacter termitis]
MKKIYNHEKINALGPYSHANIAGNMVYLSGQLGINIETGELAESIQEQTKYALENISLILKGLDLTLENVVKTTVLLDNIGDFSDMNEVYASFFPSNPPARSCFEVSKLPAQAKVEIEAIAFIG